MPYEPVEKLIERVGIPEGFRMAVKEDLIEGNPFYVWGQHNGKPQALGPHTYAGEYHIKGYLKWVNKSGRSFTHPLKEMMVRSN